MKKIMTSGFLIALVMSASLTLSASDKASSDAGSAPPVMAGGWSKFVQLSTADQEVFREALDKLAGVEYEPLVARKQVVAGMNYEFFCNARAVVPGAGWYPATVLVYKPLSGKASVKEIVALKHL